MMPGPGALMQSSLSGVAQQMEAEKVPEILKRRRSISKSNSSSSGDEENVGGI
jgi:hypothetical protein